ncbi:acyltransferase [Jiangella ureilytica]|uniref:Acyltransferase n=1 Tax=Jiangella ureilytica TaxID=2530374 RepID=A0A4R4RW57_9ACTN|nr:acyltransferase [Jiangella ureilytica]TDC54397.1 acyltransferase [Jiangella ureilytica]
MRHGTVRSDLGGLPDTGAGRLAWVDIAKTAAIVLVVFYHVGRVGLGVAPGTVGPATRPWLDLNMVLVPVRMPVFFLVSGLLAATAVSRPWPRVLRGKVLDLLWPYVLWTVVFGFVWVQTIPDDPGRWFAYNLRMLPFGGLAYWYLSLLIVFFLVAKALRHHPVPVLVATLVLLASSPAIGTWVGANGDQSVTVNVMRVSTFAVWFFAGCYLPALVRRVATAGGLGGLVAAAAGYTVLAYLFYYDHAPGGVEFFLAPVGVLAAVWAAVAIERFGWVRRLAGYLSRRTLAIYVLHPLLIHGAVWAARSSGADPLGDLDNGVVDFLFVPLFAVLVTAVAVGLYDLAGHAGMGWLFRWPVRPRVSPAPPSVPGSAVPPAPGPAPQRTPA